MDYINTSHPGFIGGSKAVEIALNQQRGARAMASKVAFPSLIDLFSISCYNL